MKRLLLILILGTGLSARADAVRVWSGAAGSGSGADWANACTTLSAGLAKVTAGGEVWVAGDQAVASRISFTTTGSVTVRGGFSATAPEATPEARAADAVSTLDANDVCSILSLSVPLGSRVTFERMVFTRAQARAIEKVNNAGDLALVGCRFVANGTACPTESDHGRAVYVTGWGDAASQRGGWIFVSNCVFRGNCSYKVNGTTAGHGAGIYAVRAAGLTVDDSSFITNGCGFATSFGYGNEPSKDGLSGSAIYVERTPTVVVRGSVFRANRGTHRNNSGGTVYLTGLTGGAAFTNCVFVGNEDPTGYNMSQSSASSGAIVAKFSSAATPISIDTCTFAYNIGDSVSGPGGVSICKGAATIRNCVFYGNRRDGQGSGGADLAVSADGSADVDYSLFTSSGIASISAIGTLVRGAHLVYGDPKFVTPLAAVEACITDWGKDGRIAFAGAKLDQVMAFDVHLQSQAGYWLNDGTKVTTGAVDSPALDAGDPAADCANEPLPNGNRLNAGGYANTARASHSSPVAPAVGTISVAFPDGQSRPDFTVSFASATPGYWIGDAVLAYGTGTVGHVVYTHTNLIGTVHNGDQAVSLGTAYFRPGTLLFAEVSVKTGTGSAQKALDPPVTVTGTLPPWIGHGGDPAKVVHVRAGAVGRATGDDWTDAVPTLAEAYPLLTATRNEIWVSGRFAFAGAVVPFKPSWSVTIRGGFTSGEDRLEDRPADGESVFDGECLANMLDIVNGAGVTVTLERFVFRHAQNRAVSKTGAGPIVVDACRFEMNGTNYSATATSGRALYLEGTSATTATVRDCVFVGNGQHAVFAGAESGPTLYAKTLARLIVDGTSFVTNGPAWTVPFGSGDNNPYSQGANGTALCLLNAPVTVRNCRFVGNRAQFRSQKDTPSDGRGGVVKLMGNCGGSAFTNCLFAVNQHVVGYSGVQTDQSGYDQGTVVLAMDSSARTVDFNFCTIAYNLGSSVYGAAGLTVKCGTANVANSIIYGNIVSANYSKTAPDIVTYDTGYVNLRYTLAGADSHSCYSTVLGAIAEGPGVFRGDPSFVTPYSTVAACPIGTGDYRFDPTKLDLLVGGTDVHLQSKIGYRLNDGTKVTTGTVDSIAIDAGDPAVACVEPTPNGKRVNCGAYANTWEASNSEPATPVIGDVTITFPDNISRPDVAFAMSGTGSGTYSATVYVLYGTGTVSQAGYAFTNILYGVRSGDNIYLKLPEYFIKGDKMTLSVVADVTGLEPVVKPAKTVTVTGELPPWWNVKCPDYVIPVCAEALGRNDGTSWKDAFTTLTKAVDVFFVDLSKREIWIAGAIEMPGDAAELVLSRALTIRGGFTRNESTAEARDPSLVSVLDGGGHFDILHLSNVASAPVELERLEFRQAHGCALRKSPSEGYLTVSGCRFVRNGLWVDDSAGLACNLKGTGVARVTFANCAFEGNILKNDNVTGTGGAIYAESLARLTVTDSLFVTNGLDITYGHSYISPGCNRFPGGAIYAKDTPTTLCGVAFRGNRCVTRHGTPDQPYNNGNQGGIVHLYGACGGSAFTNCLFTGNANTTGCSWQNGYSCGAVVIDLANKADSVDIVNTTIAYNTGASQFSGAGLTVVKGTVGLADSILYGNKRSPDSTAGADLFVLPNGVVNVRYSLLTSASSDSASALSGGTIVYGAGMRRGVPPGFVTPIETFQGLLNTVELSWPRFKPDDATRDAIATGLNVHLRGRGYLDEMTGEETPAYPRAELSPAVDTGDPNSKGYRFEPYPNGHRVNLGGYGGSPYATKSRGRGLTVYVEAP